MGCGGSAGAGVPGASGQAGAPGESMPFTLAWNDGGSCINFDVVLFIEV